MMNEDILDGFHAAGIDTKSYNSGSHYVKCPVCGDSRKKKNTRTLLINFSTGWYQCFHSDCSCKGFAQNATKKEGKREYTAPPRALQQYLPEPEWNWVFADTTIEPKPENPAVPNSPSEVTWYFRNISGKITGAKRMVYNFVNKEMKRDKDKGALWVTTRESGYYPCLFYEHDLTKYPSATVILVESEKTAALMRLKFKAFLNEFIYLAVGGANGLTEEKAVVLRGRNVWISYDCDEGEKKEDGTIKDPKGRDCALTAKERLSKLANPRIIDIDPENHSGLDLGDIYKTLEIQNIRDYGATVPDEVKISWQQTMITEKPQELPVLVAINGIPALRSRNLSLVIGKKKSRKTLFLVFEICEAIKQGVKAEEIVFFDTEQDEYDVWLVKDRVFRLSGQQITVFSIGNLNFKARKELIHNTIQHWNKPIKLCFIDGIRDLMRDINDISETTDIVDWLLMLKAKYQTHIQLVLHMNKTDSNARGHIGTELMNKCEITIELERDEAANCTMVKVESSRKRPFDPFAFTHSTEDLPEVVNAPIKGNAMPNDEKKKRLELIFSDGPMKHTALVDVTASEFGVGSNKAKTLIREFMRMGWVIKNGKDRDPNTLYSLITSSAELPYAPPKEEPQLTLENEQADLFASDDPPF